MKTKFTASEALKCLQNVSKKRLYEMMNNGDISYTNEGYGTRKVRKISASELVRVFDKDFNLHGTNETDVKPTEMENSAHVSVEDNSFIHIESQFLKDKIEILEQSLNQARKREEDLSIKLDKVHETLHSQTYLLKDMREKNDTREDNNKGFFRRIFG